MGAQLKIHWYIIFSFSKETCKSEESGGFNCALAQPWRLCLRDMGPSALGERHRQFNPMVGTWVRQATLVSATIPQP